ncbi:MAG TPA: hypothetical protein VGI39_11390 [Polyangiaceae bacterium]
MEKRSPNDLNSPVPKFCLAVEEFRRTAEGRVRTPQEFLQHFFPHDANKVTDRVFKFLPNEVRGPVLTSWGLRGAKSALKDTDDKVQSVVWDALLAGDIDHDAFEEALVADMVVRWAPITDWWTFWRGGKLSKLAIHKALDTAYELGLFDAKWFFDVIEGPGGKLRGTDVISEGLTKAELTEWVRKIHASGDGSPKGMLAAIGWDRIVGKTPNDVLVKVLDVFAQKVALTPAAKTEAEIPLDERPSTRITPVPPAPGDVAESALLNAVVGRARSIPTPAVSPAGATPSPQPMESKPPTAAELDQLFSDATTDSKVTAGDDQIVVVEEEIDVTSSNGDSPTSRPPSPPEVEQPMLLKSRPSSPNIPLPPSMRRR